jgi:hypothetical protein
MLIKSKIDVPSPWTEPCQEIRHRARRRRFAMKIQQKLDRALESFIRLNIDDWTDLPRWSPDLSEKQREDINAEVKRLIVAARKHGEGAPELVEWVRVTDESREPADKKRLQYESEMEHLAKRLPVADWITQEVAGVALPGLANIIGETGALDDYPNVAKLWKRLGLAPYDGFAGSTWKRESWRPRALTKEEWIENPFSGERYSQIYVIATWLVNAQVVSAEKSGTPFGMPSGKYGALYVKRREHTAAVHPDWTRQHCRNDALRIAVKAFLADLWGKWMISAREQMASNPPSIEVLPPEEIAPPPAAVPIEKPARQRRKAASKKAA